MSDPSPDSHLTPEQDDAVRALLASARHTGPAPAEVVARLDATLASLAAERQQRDLDTTAPVVTLASRRRRSAATLLLAAAAVVVAGVGIGQVLPTGGSDDSAGSAESATSADDQLSSAEDRSFAGDSGGDAGAEKQGDAEMRTQETAPAPSSGAASEPSPLSSDAALKPLARALRPAAPFTASFSAGPDCLLDPAPGEQVSVTYNGLPGVLVYRAPVGATQQVELFLCGQRGPLRSLQLRAP